MNRIIFVLLAIILLSAPLVIDNTASRIYGKEKTRAVDPNDPSNRLFQLLDGSYGGKLADFYLLGEIYKNPKDPSEELQRVLRVDYDKSRGFGKLNIHVRSVGKMQPDQLKSYTPKLIYDFGVADLEKFVKTGPGRLGQPGDLYLRATDDRPLATSAVTEDVQHEFDRLITDWLLPALQKK
jgi:hypothetical protein